MCMYYGYVKGVWSKNFDTLVDRLSKIKHITFLVRENDRILFEYSGNNLEEVIESLSQSVKNDAWHDIVNKTKLIVIFGSKDIQTLSFDVVGTDPTWLRMKGLEPSIRKFENAREMIFASVYGPYLR